MPTRASARSLALILLALVPTAALAQNNRSAVSINGSDLNPCTTASPCRSFTAAMAVTNVGGEIIALDSAGYGPFVIAQAVTVSGAPGIHAAISASTGSAILINPVLSGDHVNLRNLVVIGAGASRGVDIEDAGATITISDVTVSGFTQQAILNYGVETAVVDHCSVANNPGSGISTAAGGTTVITNSVVTGCAAGVEAFFSGTAAVSHCVLSNNGTGVAADPFNFAADIMVEDSTIVGNTTGAAVSTTSGTPILRLSNSVIFGNSTGVARINAGTIYSYGNNRIDGNTTDLGATVVLTAATQR